MAPIVKTHPEHAQACGWNALLPPRAPLSALTGEAHVNFVVIGAGYTGVAAARAWAERRPDDVVYLLDASTVGEGSPGRNSGFLLDIALADDADPAATDRMAQMNGLTRGAVARLRSLVETHAIDCQFAPRGTYRAAATERGLAAIAAYRLFLEAADLPYEALDRHALEARLGTSHYRGGLYSPDCHLAQPAALIRGLADALPENVRLFERSPVQVVRRDGERWCVRTDAGVIRAQHVLLANNAWAGGLGVGADRLTPVFTFAALTAPLSPDAFGSDPEWGLLPAARLGTTVRRTRDNRLLLRTGYSYRREAPRANVEARLRSSLMRRWPGLADLPFEQFWGGSTGVTFDATPVFEVREDGLMIAAGCNGGGVVKGTLFGELAVQRALGEDTPDVSTLFGRAPWVPPDPIRRIGFSLLARHWDRQAGAEA